MAEYAILIYSDEKTAAASMSEADIEALMEAHNRFPEQVEALGGSVLSGKGLQGGGTATTVRGDVVTDGPFAETKEVLGGFYIVEAKDLDHALELAKITPAPYGSVEVRPCMIFD
jgi:hypothetical protein